MSEIKYGKHYSVLKEECLKYLTENANENKQYTFLDLTFGGGGHTRALAEMKESFRVVSTDQDSEAYNNGQAMISSSNLQNKIQLLKMNFSEFASYFKENSQSLFGGIQAIDGVLMDLGVSSHHFDSPERGFSFRFDGPLDMRMSTDGHFETAKEIVNEYSQEDLADIFHEYGEERFSKRIAEKIIEERMTAPIETTKQLENIIFHCYPKKMRFTHIHPATRCFQALRIAVNRELDVLADSIAPLFELMSKGSRMAIISFHSLEDRIVKRKFLEIAESEQGKILTKKPVTPSKKELSENKRSRSAKLRIIEKL